MTSPSQVELYKQAPTPFGHEVLKYFAFDNLNLNNGAYGSAPKSVLEYVQQLTMQIETNPDIFHCHEFQPMLINVRRRVAQLIGADVDEVVFVRNTSTGVNNILRNFDWEEGDTLISFSTTFESVRKTVRYLGDIKPHPTVKEIQLLFPTTHKDILANFKDFVAANPTVEGKRTVIVIDAIISNPGVKLPWKELVNISKEAGFWTVVDAAHSIGQETDINLSESLPDFWISNCHKWLSTKRSAAVLYVPRRNQHIIKSSIPTSQSYVSAADKSDTNFITQFEWNGTIDYAPYLSVASALDFRNWLGGEHKINEYCHNLALKGGKRLAEVLGTRVMDADGELTLNMVNVELPFPGSIQMTPEISLKFSEKLLYKYKASAAYYYHNNHWWTRCSAQIWNELEDFEKLGKVWLVVCAEVLEELGLKQSSGME
ncbi:hypothetical protein C0991_004833 [Blastosporella zonata]|nr:hypothetical protein C0991_004833 [Blastosporella zonata]